VFLQQTVEHDGAAIAAPQPLGGVEPTPWREERQCSEGDDVGHDRTPLFSSRAATV
jgi:hypothetical protein